MWDEFQRLGVFTAVKIRVKILPMAHWTDNIEKDQVWSRTFLLLKFPADSQFYFDVMVLFFATVSAHTATFER